MFIVWQQQRCAAEGAREQIQLPKAKWKREERIKRSHLVFEGKHRNLPDCHHCQQMASLQIKESEIAPCGFAARRSPAKPAALRV